ncbi:MAG: FTR1 family protein [Chloroflexi bacterium]|nr:FTR1 family protein [Chloroflexota bacterium]MDK1045363.1 FTR1 family protein [Anaerolineales bacterium]MCH8338665.1 FTR1 family protein [Chloroflexota bacterium]MCH8340700.1 FTR1 family protein [Chloroflexota bacterium]MCI0773682.1 FTR1 family protein [Chloroflexota bacterium]
MVAAALIALREGLEAALIVGIVLGYLRKIGYLEGRKSVWLGVFAAVLASLGVALTIQLVGMELEGRAEGIFEGATMFLAVGVLTWMIFWMRYQARLIKTSLEQDVQQAVETGTRWGLMLVAFIAVFREGVETALFLSAAAFASDGQGTLIGAALGLTAAILIGFLIYASTARLNIRLFFNITSVLLLLFAAGLLANGIHEFQEAGVIPTVNGQLWDTNNLVDENSSLGQMLKAVVGYNGNPSLVEVVAYFSYWIAVLLGLRLWMESRYPPKLEQA